MSKKMTQVLDSLGENVLNDEAKQAISEAFDDAVSAKVSEIVKLEVENAVKQLDEDHASKLDGFLKALDDDHANKYEMAMEKVDQDHHTKLEQVVAHYNKIINEEAKKFREYMIGEISNYLELALDKTIPTKDIHEATENTQSKRLVDEMKKLLAVDEEFVSENVKEAMGDAMEQIGGLRKDMNGVIRENVKLNQELKGTRTKLLLRERTEGFPEEKKNYVMRVLSDKSPEYIGENFEYVVQMHEKDEIEKTAIIAETAKTQTVSVRENVDTPAAPIIEEESEDSVADMYVGELKKNDN